MRVISKRERVHLPLKSNEEMFRAFARASADLIDHADVSPEVVDKVQQAAEAILEDTIGNLWYGEHLELVLGHAGRMLDEQERQEERLERENLDNDIRGCA